MEYTAMTSREAKALVSQSADFCVNYAELVHGRGFWRFIWLVLLFPFFVPCFFLASLGELVGGNEERAEQEQSNVADEKEDSYDA